MSDKKRPRARKKLREIKVSSRKGGKRQKRPADRVKKDVAQKRESWTRGEIVRAILGAVGVIGVVGAVLVCPGLAKLVPSSYRGRRPYQAVWKAVVRLDKRGWIEARQTTHGWEIRLTAKGWSEWRAYEFGRKQIDQPKHWDGKWHVLMFDVPEKKRYLREKVRRVLQSFGFYRLQDSVWVYPYPCQEILNLLRTRYGIRSEALYAHLDWLDNDRWLAEHFKLPLKKS